MNLMPCDFFIVKDVGTARDYDGMIIITSSVEHPSLQSSPLQDVGRALKRFLQVDNSANDCPSVLEVSNVPGNRVIIVPTGPVNRDYDDNRRYSDAAEVAVKKAISAGWKSPIMCVLTSDEGVAPKSAHNVAILGAFQGLYVPLEIREALPNKVRKFERLGFLKTGDQEVHTDQLFAMESGRAVARDIGGSDPERMAPPRVEEYIMKIFENSGLTISVVKDDDLLKEYPLFAAVDRCARSQERHKGRAIFLEYNPETAEKTLMFVGKGVTYDTGGADIKAGGVMAGMHRDKCGAAAVAGIMCTVALLKPANVKVVAALCMVRNSVGSNAYVSDEIITSRAGLRVRIGNTDAEGRMAMGDVLCHMREKAEKEVNPHLFTIATLTGHAVLACGEYNYSVAIDNGPARKLRYAAKLQDRGDECGDPVEVSTCRREDYAKCAGRNEYEDILQANSAPSVKTCRGHQLPAAFLTRVGGLDKHGVDSNKPIKYTHLDIAGSAGQYPGIPSGAPVVVLTCTELLSKF